MKIKMHFLFWLVLVFFFTACKKDNFDAPRSKLTGAILYQGDTIHVAYNQVTFELWQPGFGKLTPIIDTVNQDGLYSTLLFNGDYKLIISAGQGPFRSQVDPESHSDTIMVNVQGNQVKDIEVLPYYMIRTPQFSISDGTVQGTCSLEKIITDAGARDIESVSLYLSKTLFVDDRTSIATTTVDGTGIPDLNHINLTVTVPHMVPEQSYVFARIGVKISGVEDLLFSPVAKISF